MKLYELNGVFLSERRRPLMCTVHTADLTLSYTDRMEAVIARYGSRDVEYIRVLEDGELQIRISKQHVWVSTRHGGSTGDSDVHVYMDKELALIAFKEEADKFAKEYNLKWDACDEDEYKCNNSDGVEMFLKEREVEEEN